GARTASPSSRDQSPGLLGRCAPATRSIPVAGWSRKQPDGPGGNAMNATEIVVGVDGSASSRTALRWAAGQAGRTGAPLRVLLAYHWRLPGSFATSAKLERAANDQAELVVEAAVAEARATAPGVPVAGAAVLG